MVHMGGKCLARASGMRGRRDGTVFKLVFFFCPHTLMFVSLKDKKQLMMNLKRKTCKSLK